ncbi:hypothetical protein MRX96_016758 [Rhipicephalus microplus]
MSVLALVECGWWRRGGLLGNYLLSASVNHPKQWSVRHEWPQDPLESLRLFIAWAIVAAVLCFCGSVALSMVLKWGDITLVLIVLCKFYCHHLRKVKEGQPLYTPYDHGAHREHHRVFAPQPHHERTLSVGMRHVAVPSTSAEATVAVSSPKRADSLTQEGV